MADYVEQGEVKQLLVQRKDGSTWRAEIGIDGRVRLIEQLNQTSTPELDEEEDEQPQDQQDQSQADQGEGEAQPAQPSSEDQWGEVKPLEQGNYSDKEIDQLIEGMEHRGSSDKGSDGQKIPEEYKLSAEYHAKLKDPAFMSRLRSVMLDNKFARRVRGRTRGKLDMGRLYKVPTMSRNVFLQKQERKGKMYNVILTIDQSGSMGGRKSQLAAEITLFLAKQFENLNINIGVIGFDTEVYTYKELNNNKINYDELYMKVGDIPGGGTNDYPALRRAYHMFSQAPEGKNILIHLSDGSPGSYDDTVFYGVDGKRENIKKLPDLVKGKHHSEYVDYNEKEHLHHLVKSHPEVEAYGIGILAGGWQIPDHEVVHNLDDMKPAFLRFLRKHITRG